MITHDWLLNVELIACISPPHPLLDLLPSRMAPLPPSVEHRASLQAFENRAETDPAISPADLAWIRSSNAYQRYLTAHNWDLDTAFAKLLATLQWREEVKPHLLTMEDVYEEAKEGNIYLGGTDKEGRPLVIIKRRGKLKDPALQLKLYFYTLEQAGRIISPEGLQKTIWIFDLEGLSSSNSPPISILLELLRTLSAHYPERMHKAFFLYQGFIFTGLFSLVYPFLDARQRAKINVIGKDFSTLLEDVDASQLEKRHGGTLQKEYDASGELSQSSTAPEPPA